MHLKTVIVLQKREWIYSFVAPVENETELVKHPNGESGLNA